MLYAALVGLLLAPGGQASPDASAPAGPLAQIAGDWQVVNEQTGAVAMTCAQAQRFEVAPDRRSVMLTQLDIANWSARYRVLRADRTHLLMRLDNEERRTKRGRPVRWWTQFNGPDEFRWRRDDWNRGAVTQTVWRRCSGN